MPPNNPTKITITVAGAEGDTVDVEINVHQKLTQLLREGLKELYGNPPRDASTYDIVIAGTVVANLDQTVEDAGLHNGDEIAILPKDVSRG